MACDDWPVDHAVVNRRCDESCSNRFIHWQRGILPGLVIPLYLKQALDRIRYFVIVNNLVVNVAEQNKVVETVSLLVRLALVISCSPWFFAFDVTYRSDYRS